MDLPQQIIGGRYFYTVKFRKSTVRLRRYWVI